MSSLENSTFISIVIPCFNERQRLPKTLNKILAYFNSSKSPIQKWEILVVDDGSSDQTGDFIKSEFQNIVKVIKLKKNQGKGAAVKAGVLAATGEQILICDADGSTPITELPRLQQALKSDSVIVIGSRQDEELISKKQSGYRIFLGKTFNFLVRLIVGVNFKDTQCGFKLGKGDELRELFEELNTKGFAFDVELLFLAKLHEYKTTELPVLWMHDQRSKVKIWQDPFFMFIELIKLKLTHSLRHKHKHPMQVAS